MPSQYHLNTDHWSKMRMNIIKSAINIERQGRVLSWEKHQKKNVQNELKAAIHGGRSLPRHDVGFVHSFQDIFTLDLDGCVPGSSYIRRKPGQHAKRDNVHTARSNISRQSSLTGSLYTLMTLPTDPQSDQTRSRVPVLQCRGKI